MRFWKILGFTSLLAVAPVSAGLMDGLGSGLDYVFGFGMSNINFLRLLMAIVIVAILYNSLESAFSGNKAAAIVVSVVVALIGVRFMPEALLLKLTLFIWLLVFLAIPYLLIGRVVENIWARIVGSVVAAGVLLYLLQDYLDLGFDLGFLENVYYLVADSWYWIWATWLIGVAVIAVVIVVGSFLLKKRED